MIRFTKLRDVKSPTRWTELSSWIDFYVPNHLEVEDLTLTPSKGANCNIDLKDYVKENFISIPPHCWIKIPSWLKILMDRGWEDWTYEMVLYNKSWIATKYNLIVWANVVDNDYRGEFNIHLINTTDEVISVDFGQKIVQWIVRKVQLDKLEEISNEEYEKYSDTERGEGWFGSTWN